MRRILSITLLVFLSLWSAGCSTPLELPSPTFPPPGVTTIPAYPTGSPTKSSVLLPAIHTPTPTKEANEVSVLTAELILAAEKGDTPTVLRLLSEGADINGVDARGRTAGMTATHRNQVGTVQALIQAGANITIPDKDGVTPVEHARARGFEEIERILVEATQARDMGLIAAAGQGIIESAYQLLEQGASVSARDEDGRTALVVAAYRNDLAIAELLIRAGADVNAQDNTKQSAYLIATSEGYLGLLRLTLQTGADIHSLDSYNGTGLIRAAERGHVEIIRELLMTDINIDHVNRLGWTALLEAIILGTGGERHTEVVRLLVASGADVDLADGHGVTPLAHARQLGYQQIAEILERAGAD